MTQPRRPAMIRTAVLAASATGALVLSGCAGAAGPADGGQDQTDTKEFSISFGPANDEKTGYEILAEQYMQENPDVTITMNPLPGETYPQAIRTQLQAGNASDLFVAAPGTGQPYSLVPLAEAGLISPLDGAAADVIPAGSDDLFVVDGEVYGQALSVAFVANIFNTTPGVEYPADLAGLLDQCAAAQAEGRSFFVIAGAVPINTGIMAQSIAATRVYVEDPDWNDKRAAGEVSFADSEGWQDTLETVLALDEAGCFQAGAEGAGFDAITNGLTQGTSLGMFGPSGTASEINAAAGGHASFVVEAFPVETEGDARFGLASSTYAYALSADSKNKVAALKFLDWMAEPEQTARFAEIEGDLPVSGIDDLDLADSVFAPVEDILKSGSYAPLPNATWPNAAVYDALGMGVQGLLTGQRTVDQVLADMDAAWGE